MTSKTKPKTKIFLSLFFFVSFSMIFLVNNVNAQEYYNHVLNPSFKIYPDYCEDGGFESGGFDNGLVYGNWSNVEGGSVSTTSPHSGVYCGRIYVDGVGVNTINYTLSSEYTNLLGADIENVTFYLRRIQAFHSFKVQVYYSDASYDEHTYSTTVSSWVQCSFIDYINDAKYVQYFKIILLSVPLTIDYGYIDDVSILVNDGEGQDEITVNSEPWNLGASDFQYNFGEINTVTGRTDSYSVQMSGATGYILAQRMDYIDTNYIEFINCYVLNFDVAEGDGLSVTVVYSDRTESWKTKYVTGDGTSWEEINFGKSFIDSNKYIIRIVFRIISDDNYSGASALMDDVGLWVSYPLGFSKFDFSVSPYPIDKTSYSFSAYCESQYTLNCYYYNITDYGLNINGTYQLSTSYGVDSGNMVNGFFSIVLDIRHFTTSPYKLETFSIIIITDDEIFNTELNVYWYPVTGDIDYTSFDDENLSDFMINFILYALFFIAIPLMLAIYINGEFNNPQFALLTFIGGLTLMGAICLQIGFIDLWFMIVILVIDVVMIFALLRRNA